MVEDIGLKLQISLFH